MAASLAGLPKAPSQLGPHLPVAAWVDGVLLLAEGHSLGGHALLKHARTGKDVANALHVADPAVIVKLTLQ